MRAFPLPIRAAVLAAASLGAVVAAPVAAAQAPAVPVAAAGRHASPDAVARAAFAAIDGKRWRVLLDLVDSASFAERRAAELRNARQVEQAVAPTAVTFMRANPDMPPARAEQLAREWQAAHSQGNLYVTSHFAGVRTAAELEALTPARFLGSWVEGRSVEHLMQRDRPAAPAPAATATGARARGADARAPSTVRTVAATRIRRDALGGWRLTMDAGFLPTGA